MTANSDRRRPGATSAAQWRRTLTIIWRATTRLLLAAGATVLIVVLTVLVTPGAPSLAFKFLANLPTTTVEWPNPDTVALRERTEQQFPPPPASSFETATITTYIDGDRWKCVRYKTDASAADTRAYYTKLLHEMKYGSGDGYGQDGPYTWQLSVIAMNGTVRLTTWDGRVPMESAPPPYRVAVCFTYEPWTYPKIERSPIPTPMVFWP